MTNDVDFNEIGRKTPYRIPEGFFDKMQEQVLLHIEEKPHSHIISFKHLPYVVIGIAAAVLTFIFIPRPFSESETDTETTSWIEQLSDEDLKAMDEMSEYDIFMY